MTTTQLCSVCGENQPTWVLHPGGGIRGGDVLLVCTETSCLYSLPAFSRHRLTGHTCLTCDY
jgi:hypothetical protein